jgi:hypothetical protein
MLKIQLDLEYIARVCHEAQRALALAFGDERLEPWELESQGKRQTVMQGVHFAVAAMKDATEKTLLQFAQEQHDSWFKEYEKRGWVQGPYYSHEQKTHPNMVPFELLSERQKAKDMLFRSIVMALVRDLAVTIETPKAEVKDAS